MPHARLIPDIQTPNPTPPSLPNLPNPSQTPTHIVQPLRSLPYSPPPILTPPDLIILTLITPRILMPTPHTNPPLALIIDPIRSLALATKPLPAALLKMRRNHVTRTDFLRDGLHHIFSAYDG
ncbi:uncharacterized protein LY89DRAFT_691545 [Mollisia scopiformis]|uniref:Uncharacterized protein n=1 Tax=Mollisia scopiformis TaxID=149040 RepID=A0A132B865_MOLSC|nr:uncharacterized protein LY89DRAFT_691545 [Mollisia scopiformis]KUJ07867.1 hypothetical protein LY89DRAFT_691545 [Mollisia scopiformis]